MLSAMGFILTSYALETLVLLTTLAYILYRFSIRNFDYWEKRGVLYPKPTPFLGNFGEILTFKETMGHCLGNLYNQFKTPYFGMFIFNRHHLVIRSPELIKTILVKDFNYFCDRNVLCDEKTDSFSSNMLFSLRNPEWKFMRTKMTPVFTSGKIKNMVGLINAAAEDMKDYFGKIAGKESVELKELCSKYATDVVASCAFGINANSFKYENAKFREIGRKMFSNSWMSSFRQSAFFVAHGLAKFFRIGFFEASITNFFRKVFWQTIEEREKTKHKRNDLIDIIIQIRSQITPNDEIKFEGDRVVAQAGIFFAAGFETTSSTISFTLYELCVQPKIQSKVRNEIKTVMAKHGGLTYEAAQDMKYLHMVLCETLRKYPVLPFLDRMCVEDYKIPGSDLVIEKGTPVFIPLFGLHYDKKYFPDPDKYDPERFSEENRHSLPPFAYIPFGEGPRNCIGERFALIAMKLGIACILSEFELEVNSKTPIPLEFEKKSLLLASTVGLPMKIKKVVSNNV